MSIDSRPLSSIEHDHVGFAHRQYAHSPCSERHTLRHHAVGRRASRNRTTSADRSSSRCPARAFLHHIFLHGCKRRTSSSIERLVQLGVVFAFIVVQRGKVLGIHRSPNGLGPGSVDASVTGWLSSAPSATSASSEETVDRSEASSSGTSSSETDAPSSNMLLETESASSGSSTSESLTGAVPPERLRSRLRPPDLESSANPTWDTWSQPVPRRVRRHKLLQEEILLSCLFWAWCFLSFSW